MGAVGLQSLRVVFTVAFYREKKQKFSLMFKLINRWRILQNCILFLAQTVPSLGGSSRLEGLQDQLTYNQLPSSGKILN